MESGCWREEEGMRRGLSGRLLMGVELQELPPPPSIAAMDSSSPSSSIAEAWGGGGS